MDAPQPFIKRPILIFLLENLRQHTVLTWATAVGTWFFDEPDYLNTVSSEFNLLVPESEMNFRVIHPENGRFDFSAADKICDLAKKDGLQVRGHALVWDSNLPQWITKVPTEKKAKILKDHIQTTILLFLILDGNIRDSYVVGLL